MSHVTLAQGEAELSAHLEDLLAQFRVWKEKRINAHDLSQKIHEFHDGPARQLRGFYHANSGRNSQAPLLVASAVARGFLQTEQLGDTLARKLAPTIDHFKGRDT